MGKQGKRKQRQKRKEQKKHEQATSVNSSSAIHQLRHPEPKTRHAALIALQTTILHPDQTKKISLSVLQAVREQVMDSHLECASAAAECLSQYLFFGNDDYNEATAGWVLVLINRLDQCLVGIREKPTKAWYALAAPCLRALCKLVEANELALDQVHTQTQTFLSTIFGLMQSSITSMETAMATAPLDERFVEWIRETTIFAARTLHSALDENEQLALSVQKEAMEPWSGEQLLSKLPDLAQLHITGSVVMLYQLAPSQWQTLLPNAVNCLTRFLVVEPTELQSLEQNYRDAKQLWNTQKEDDELEQEIIKKVQARREPARAIARRQKANPREEKAASMEEQDQRDGRQAMEDALVAWNGTILPIQVALEITANLLSCLIQDEDDMAVEKDNSMDQTLRGGLVASKLTERCFQMLQAVCNYQHEHQSSQENESLKEDLEDCTSKISGCLVNCVLGGVMLEAEVMPSWQILRQYANKRGVCSTMVVMTQQYPSLRELLCQDVELFAGLVQSQDGEVQRDGVCLLTAALSGPTPVEIVSKVTAEMIRLLNDGLTTSVKVEVLNGFMNLYGEDDFHPQVFDDLKVLGAIQQSLLSLPKKELDPVEEDILSNAHRFVDYKLGR